MEHTFVVDVAAVVAVRENPKRNRSAFRSVRLSFHSISWLLLRGEKGDELLKTIHQLVEWLEPVGNTKSRK